MPAGEAGPAPKPLYAVVKAHVTQRIRDGSWPPGTRIPSENALGPQLGVSRITINRAFAELARDGVLDKVPGVGTFVARAKPRFGLMTIQDIAEEITARGMAWSSQVLALAELPAPAEAAAALGLKPGTAVPHSAVLHRGDAAPIQHEARWLRPGYSDGYLAQDYTRGTTFAHLVRTGRAKEMEQSITAILPDAALARLLAVPRNQPCLVIRRVTFTDGVPMTLSRLVQPADRFEIAGRAVLENG
ncbi:UTRA domain-containing protein [Falsiroseomonas selenitidurans]|uniref:UTRA domain-containing protein n=1 Tax=Falsiroseomonas selenitidurans TaxID=2716335 RepID=A0ABX1E7W3_9PROT|nr:UTRA domain-containing protein [Falsiroseomonas selenitidurans]NKC32835.1 UTRA domain-containing protein [Falsiroseomonas selenitidurans]